MLAPTDVLCPFCHCCPLCAASPTPTLRGLLSCSPKMLPICAGSLLPFQTALARCGRPPLGQLAFPERGNTSQALLCPACLPSSLPSGQARGESANRPEKAPCCSGAGTRGRKAMPTAGPSLEGGHGSYSSYSSGLAWSGRSWAGPTRVPPMGQCREIRALIPPVGAGGPVG